MDEDQHNVVSYAKTTWRSRLAQLAVDQSEIVVVGSFENKGNRFHTDWTHCSLNSIITNIIILDWCSSFILWCKSSDDNDVDDWKCTKSIDHQFNHQSEWIYFSVWFKPLRGTCKQDAQKRVEHSASAMRLINCPHIAAKCESDVFHRLASRPFACDSTHTMRDDKILLETKEIVFHHMRSLCRCAAAITCVRARKLAGA